MKLRKITQEKRTKTKFDHHAAETVHRIVFKKGGGILKGGGDCNVLSVLTIFTVFIFIFKFL